jgi:hypothetical protein
MTSPTFVCRFSDGVTTKMTTHCTPDNLDLRRGIALAHVAYRSRTGKQPPRIACAHFQTLHGVVLREYAEKEITDVTVKPLKGAALSDRPGEPAAVH